MASPEIGNHPVGFGSLFLKSVYSNVIAFIISVRDTFSGLTPDIVAMRANRFMLPSRSIFCASAVRWYCSANESQLTSSFWLLSSFTRTSLNRLRSSAAINRSKSSLLCICIKARSMNSLSSTNFMQYSPTFSKPSTPGVNPAKAATR